MKVQQESTTVENFKVYIQNLSKKMDGQAFALYMDNLHAHRNKEVRALMTALKITPIYNISYSPDFNCIEAVFA